jgi:hypothetical protein
MNTSSSTSRALFGALAGAAGGAVMAMMMQKIAPKVMPQSMRPDEFIPKKAIQWAERTAGRPDALGDSTEMKAAMGAHLGYSALAGAVYGLARPLARDLPVPISGAAFGMGVWALSFEGWMPAMGIMERTTDEPPRKWPAPIMGHAIYGVATALAYEGLGALGERYDHRRERPLPTGSHTARDPVLERDQVHSPR